MASPRREPGTGDGFPRQPNARPPQAASAPRPPDHHGARLRGGDLYALVRQLLTEAGLYDPALSTSHLRLILSGRSVVIGWSATAPQPRLGIQHAIRHALLELLAAAGLDARYEPPAGRRTGTITVTCPDCTHRNAEPHPASASAARSARSPFD